MENLFALEERLGVEFSDYALLGTALTHRSYINENSDAIEDNERLEYLGDAVIDLIVADYLYNRFAKMNEGEMTSLRSALVRAETLAEFATNVEIDKALRLGMGEDDNGGRKRIPTLCAAFEAVVGAMYLDVGYDATRTFLIDLIGPKLEYIQEHGLHKDARSEFQIWAQAQFGSTPRYEVVSVDGPDHDRRFTVQVMVKDQAWGEGSGRSKQVAAQAAARKAMNNALTEQ
ncbi:MAG: ribonuclease III [Chloroflexota bacterium]